MSKRPWEGWVLPLAPLSQAACDVLEAALGVSEMAFEGYTAAFLHECQNLAGYTVEEVEAALVRLEELGFVCGLPVPGRYDLRSYTHIGDVLAAPMLARERHRLAEERAAYEARLRAPRFRPSLLAV